MTPPDAGGWDACSAGWDRNSDRFERFVQAVTLELVDSLGLFSGETVVELACGPGGMLPLLAELVSPGGKVLAGDISPGMVEAAAGRAGMCGLPGIEVSELALDWIDLPSASAGALVCRFGYMFADDPSAALAEARRVLRPGGRFATAVWDDPARNPYGTVAVRALAAIGLADEPKAGDPGMFRLAEQGRMEGLLLDAGFTEVQVRPVGVSMSFEGLDDLLAWFDGISQTVSTALSVGHPGSRDEFALEVARLIAPHEDDGARISLPGVALVASGRA